MGLRALDDMDEHTAKRENAAQGLRRRCYAVGRRYSR